MEIYNHAPLHLEHTRLAAVWRSHTSTFKWPVATSSDVASSNPQNTCEPTLTSFPSSVSEPRPHVTSHLTFTLPTTVAHIHPPWQLILPLLPSNHIVGNKLRTLLHCPHSSPLSQPAIQGLASALCRYNLCSWSSHTATPNDTQCQVCQSPFNEDKMLLCDILKTGWQWTSSSLPSLPTWDLETPYPPRLSQAAPRHLRLPSPILTPTPMNTRPTFEKGGGGDERIEAFIFWLLCRHTASPPNASGTHTSGVQ